MQIQTVSSITAILPNWGCKSF